jgi:hypothetical protein
MGNKLCPKIIPEGTPTTYTYGDSAHKHAVTALNTGEGYTYDANGNMTQRVEGGLTYTQTFRQAQCDAFDADCEASPKGRTD